MSSFFQNKGRRFCSYGSVCVQHKNPPNVKCKTNQCHGEENGVRCTNRVHHMCSISVGLDEREQSFCPIHCANAKKTCVLVESNIPLPPVSSKKKRTRTNNSRTKIPAPKVKMVKKKKRSPNSLMSMWGKKCRTKNVAVCKKAVTATPIALYKISTYDFNVYIRFWPYIHTIFSCVHTILVVCKNKKKSYVGVTKNRM